MAKKCDNCLRAAKVRTTGTSPKDATLKMDMGGAVLYVMPLIAKDLHLIL